MFPIIKDLASFRAAVSDIPEITESKIGEELVCFGYNISKHDTFASALARECRGIVFNTQSGKVVSRPLHKFFNVGEREETQRSVLPWDNVARIMDKRDGSMIHTVIMPHHQVDVKSKRSFSSDVANAARKFIKAHINYSVFCSAIASKNKTAIFEFTSPDARIVLPYAKDELKLLHIRDNETGVYSGLDELKNWSATFTIPLVDEIQKSSEQIFKDCDDATNIEGWVIQFSSGEMVKLKTPWYLARHRVMTFVRERDVANLVLSGDIDDMVTTLVAEGVDISEVTKIQNKVVDTLNSFKQQVRILGAQIRDLPRKEGYEKVQNNQLCRFIMREAQEPHDDEVLEQNLIEYYRTSVLKEWSLRTISFSDTVEEE